MVVCSPLMQAKQDGSIGIYNLSEEFVCWRCQSLAKQRLIPTEAHRDIADTDDSPRTFHFFLTCQANPAQHECVKQSGIGRTPPHGPSRIISQMPTLYLALFQGLQRTRL